MNTGMRPCEPVLAALTAPATLAGQNVVGWSRLIDGARAVNLLGALAARCRTQGLDVPPLARRHLDGALQVAQRQRMSVGWEAHELQSALGQLGIPVVLLKGAAYVMAGHPVGVGRTFGDIDILVPREALGDVESRLLLHSWVGAKTDPYDQRYYREWMHELPPMVHMRRGTVIDVHHTILPLTARHAPDPSQLIARSQPVPHLPALRVPCPEDMLIHSLTHLMHEGELHNGLRDLNDIDDLTRHFGPQPGFWDRVTSLASENDLALPVSCGLTLARRYFLTPVPDEVLQALTAVAGPPPRWLEPMYRRALVPATIMGPAPALARLAVYVRAHALRMPLPMLARHLTIKAWRGIRPVPRKSG